MNTWNRYYQVLGIVLANVMEIHTSMKHDTKNCCDTSWYLDLYFFLLQTFCRLYIYILCILYTPIYLGI